MLDLQRTDFEELFLGLDKRRGGRTYFYRTAVTSEAFDKAVERYIAAARQNGAVIAGKLSNPEGNQVKYFMDMTDGDFRLDEMLIGRTLARWLPQMNNAQCTAMAKSMTNALMSFKALGKTDAMVKNFYVRLMCWLYYRFVSITTHIGENNPPKILYGGSIGRHELLLLKMLSDCGCDVLYLQYSGEDDYNSFDPKGELSQKLAVPSMKPFPQGYDLKRVEESAQAAARRAALTGGSSLTRVTNVWMKGKDILDDIQRTPSVRTTQENTICNAYCRLTGVPDKLTYKNDLYRFYAELKNSGRRYVIEENKIEMPNNTEIMLIDRVGQATTDQLVTAMLKSLKRHPNDELRKLISSAFAEVIFEEAESEGMTPQRLNTMATCMICWINRYMSALFSGWSMPMVPVFVYLGGCKNIHEAAFLKMLSRTPCDVLILAPNLNVRCQLADGALFELKYNDTLNVTEFPTEQSGLQVGTAAYHAERELDEALYNGTGMFRDYQYNKANSVVLRTMYEEIDILWKQETRFRPNFSVVDDTVNVPVIFAKVSGVKDAQPTKYWKAVQNLLTDNTFIISGAPFLTQNLPNPMKYNSGNYIRNGRLNREAAKASRDYPYRHLREETQTFIFDKIDLLISSRAIKGTFENGMEYLIAATLLYMPAQIVRMIQGFDFTKVNPKIIYINTGETPISTEDAILMAFLSLAGFDVLFLVPTGYQTVEGCYGKDILDEHKVGEFMYDMRAPRFKIPKTKPAPAKSKSLFGNLFKK